MRFFFNLIYLVDYRLWVRVRVGHIFMSKILFRTVLDKKKKHILYDPL